MSVNRRFVLILAIVLVGVGAAGIILRSKINPAMAGILIETNPSATVYINGEQVGQTPYEETRTAGEVTLRLVPIATNNPLSPWDTKLTLTEGIKTVVRRDFGETDARSAGDVLSFEKIPGNGAGITIVSSPDASQVALDGQARGFTPIRIESIPVGEHEIAVSAPGHLERSITARAEPGFRLTVVAMLARLEEEEEASPAGQIEVEVEETMVEILDTPTGFLRVREEPTTASRELAKVEPGTKHVFIEENDDSTWFKIEYEDGKEGWVSAQYAKKVESQ